MSDTQIAALEARIRELESVVDHQDERLDGLVRIASSLASSRDPRKAMKAMVTEISRLLKADRTTIYELRRDSQLLRGLAVQGEIALEVGIPLGEGIAGLVAQRNRTINVKDAYRHPDFDPKYDKLTGYRSQSMLCVPMRNPKKEVIGVIQALNKADGYFTVADEHLLVAMATQAAITLEALHLQLRLNISNAELRELSHQLRQKIHELELLYDNERAIAEAQDLDDLAGRVLEVAARVAGCELAGLFLPDDSGYGPLYLKGGSADSPLRCVPRVEIGEGVLGKTANRGEALILRNDDFERLGIPRIVGTKIDVRVEDAVTAPLIDGQRTVGALAFVNRNAPTHRDDLADRQLAVLLAGQLSRAVVRVTQRRSAKLNDRLQTIGRMLSGVLHDLRGPMTIISGYSQLMAHTEDIQERTDMADSIRSQVLQFNDMTREVMSFARGERRVFSRKVYLDKFIKAVKEALRPEFDDLGIGFEINHEANPTAWFDEAKMMRVVTNIARNARQAMGSTGTFTWSLSTTDDGHTLFRLQDDGPGIPEAIRETLFDAFTTSGKDEGTGLGLAIVRRIVEDHGGSIAFTTSTGRGTTFTIQLPGPPEETTPPR